MGGFLGGLAAGAQGASTAFRNFNNLQQQGLQNQLLQQEMMLKQREQDLQQRQQLMQEAQLRFNMGHEVYNQKQQEAAQQAAAAMFSSSGSLARTPEERQFWDWAGNAAANHMPPEYIFKMANAMGYGDEAKQALEMYKSMYYGSMAALNTGLTSAISGATGAPGTAGMTTGAMTPGGSLGTSPMPLYPGMGRSVAGYPSAPRALPTRPVAPGVAPTYGSGYAGVPVPAGVAPTLPGYGGGGAASASAAPSAGAGLRWDPTGTKYWDPADGEIHDARTGAVVSG